MITTVGIRNDLLLPLGLSISWDVIYIVVDI